MRLLALGQLLLLFRRLLTRKTSAWLTGAFTALVAWCLLEDFRVKGVMLLSIPPVLRGTLFAR